MLPPPAAAAAAKSDDESDDAGKKVRRGHSLRRPRGRRAARLTSRPPRHRCCDAHFSTVARVRGLHWPALGSARAHVRRFLGALPLARSHIRFACSAHLRAATSEAAPRAFSCRGSPGLVAACDPRGERTGKTKLSKLNCLPGIHQTSSSIATGGPDLYGIFKL